MGAVLGKAMVVGRGSLGGACAHGSAQPAPLPEGEVTAAFFEALASGVDLCALAAQLCGKQVVVDYHS